MFEYSASKLLDLELLLDGLIGLSKGEPWLIALQLLHEPDLVLGRSPSCGRKPDVMLGSVLVPVRFGTFSVSKWCAHDFLFKTWFKMSSVRI